MKIISFFCRLTAIATSAFLLAFIYERYALALYAVAASSFILLIVARDYAPKPRRWEPRLMTAQPNRPQPSPEQRLRLAA